MFLCGCGVSEGLLVVLFRVFLLLLWLISGSVYGSRIGSCGGIMVVVILDWVVEVSEIVDVLKFFGVI